MKDYKTGRCEIFNVRIDEFSYSSLLAQIIEIMNGTEKKAIGYVTASKLNNSFSDSGFADILNSFDYLHADGMGTYLASKIIHGSKGLKERITGSDFYPLLAKEIIRNRWRVFLFGDSTDTLLKIKEYYRGMVIAGMNNCLGVNDTKVVEMINSSRSDLLIIGLPTPTQEEWIIRNRKALSTKLILAVGDGLKVFAGVRRRGPEFVRALGLEWTVRLIQDPRRMWRRYLIGIPQFIYRVCLKKAGNTHGTF